MGHEVEPNAARFDAVKARLNPFGWIKPGVRHVGLTRDDFALLAQSDKYTVVNRNNETLVTWLIKPADVDWPGKTKVFYEPDEPDEITLCFDENGRLVSDHSTDFFGSNYDIAYDSTGRVIRVRQSGGNSDGGFFVTKSYKYDDASCYPEFNYDVVIESEILGVHTRELGQRRVTLKDLIEHGYGTGVI